MNKSLVLSFSYGNHGVVRAAVDREHVVLKDFIASDLRGTGSTAYREVRAAAEAALRGEPVTDDLTYDTPDRRCDWGRVYPVDSPSGASEFRRTVPACQTRISHERLLRPRGCDDHADHHPGRRRVGGAVGVAV